LNQEYKPRINHYKDRARSESFPPFLFKKIVMETTFNRIIVKETGFAFDYTDELGLTSMWDLEESREKLGILYRKGVVKYSNKGLTPTETLIIYNNTQAKPCSVGDNDKLVMLQDSMAEAEIKEGFIHALGEHIFVEPFVPDEVLPSGLILPGKIDEKSLQGIVINTGPKVNDIKVGDRVLYGKVSGHGFKFKGKPYRLMKESTVYGIIES